MLTYHLMKNDSGSLYLQLYHSLKEDILSGKLASDEKLPGKRPFARHLGVSVITVENAYETLKAEGYIYSLPKKGYYVSPEISASLGDNPAFSGDDSGERAAILPGSSSREQSTEFSDSSSREQSTELIDLSVNRVLPELFPFSVWAQESRRVIAEGSDRLLEPAPGRGVRELREAISRHLSSFRGIRVSPEQIVIGAGTEYLYGLLIQLLGRDRVYAVEEPGYQKIRRVYDANNVSWQSVLMDEKGVPADILTEKGIQVLHISPSHHFPTGIVMPIGRRYELLGWSAAADDRYIIEDDYDSELRLSGRPIPAMYGIDRAGKVIYMNTFSKTFAPSVRISYMVLPRELSDRFEEKLGFYSCTVGSLSQYTLAKFMTDGHFESHLNRLRRYYRQWHSEMTAQFSRSPFLRRAEIMEDAAGLHFLLRLTSGVSDSRLKETASACGLKAACLSDYFTDPASASHGILVINYSSLGIEKLPQVIERLEELSRRLSREV